MRTMASLAAETVSAATCSEPGWMSTSITISRPMAWLAR